VDARNAARWIGVAVAPAGSPDAPPSDGESATAYYPLALHGEIIRSDDVAETVAHLS
jgi:hypothetical protein